MSTSEEFILKDSEWIVGRVELPFPRSGFACLNIDAYIYIFGGTDGVPLKQVDMWDGQEWIGLMSMHQRRDELAVVLGSDMRVYAIGGFGGKDMYVAHRSCLRTVESFSIEENTWRGVASLNTPRRALAAVALPSGLYALGGYDGANYLNSMERFDYARNAWTELSPMKYPRCTLAAVANPDAQYIYAIGGFDGAALSVVERYSISEDCWVEITPLSEPRFMHSCVLVTYS